MKSITLSSKNQVVIPSVVRYKLGVKSGDKLIIKELSNTEVVLQKEPSYFDLIGALHPQSEDATKRVRSLRNAWK